MCVQMRSGVEIWVEDDKAQRLKQVLTEARESKFIEFHDQIINSVDIVGIFTAATMEDHTKRKNGQWNCDSGQWHDKFTRCECGRALPKFKPEEKEVKPIRNMKERLKEEFPDEHKRVYGI